MNEIRELIGDKKDDVHSKIIMNRTWLLTLLVAVAFTMILSSILTPGERVPTVYANQYDPSKFERYEVVAIPPEVVEVVEVVEASEEIPNIQKPAIWPVGHPGREADELYSIRISRYDPNLGGVNCYQWSYQEQRCLSRTASGEDWENKYGEIAACPREWPFGTIFELDGTFWRCSDRGGKIVKNHDGTYWVDLLLDHSPYSFGQVRQASVWFPKDGR